MQRELTGTTSRYEESKTYFVFSMFARSFFIVFIIIKKKISRDIVEDATRRSPS